MATDNAAILDTPARKGAALITGSAKRIGRTISLALAGKGYDIALHYHSSRRDAEQARNEIESLWRRCSIFPCDLNHPEASASLPSAVFEVFPECNLLINNASIIEPGQLMDNDERILDRHFTVNFKSPFSLFQEFARHCKKGNLINIQDSRTAGADTERFAYTLTKKALLEFTKMAARDLAPHIRANGVCPGFISSPAGKDESYSKHKGNTLPPKRTGGPENLVSAVLFLVDNYFIAGKPLYIDGGEHIQ
jgi:NAD(P)-dependent dehydrogenase (short-subunit alcohol dehydrogenase family)